MKSTQEGISYEPTAINSRKFWHEIFWYVVIAIKKLMENTRVLPTARKRNFFRYRYYYLL